MTLCSPWVDIGDVRLCSPSKFPDGIYVKALAASASMLYQITQFRWPGLCSDLVRPCKNSPGALQLLDYPNGGSRPVASPWNTGFPCSCSSDDLVCGCRTHSNVVLPGYPLVDVTEVKLDGNVFTGYRIADDRSLIRTDGLSWPCCQNLLLADTEPGTWSIAYRYGAIPGPDGLVANEVLACELAKSWDGCDDCQLSPRVTSLVHEGETFTLADLNQALDAGKFGLREVDWFVEVANAGQPAGRPGAKVLSAAAMFDNVHRVRP